MLAAMEFGHLGLKGLMILPHDILPRGKDLVDGRVKLRRKLVVLGFDVVEGNSHGIMTARTRAPCSYSDISTSVAVTAGPKRLKSAIAHPSVILASASPRRQELLRQLVAEFEIVPSDLPEYELTNPWITANRLALDKAIAVARNRPEAVVIGADTVVAYNHLVWRQLAKPSNEDDACSMLRQLSAIRHVVITGVAVVAPRCVESATETTHVRFRSLSDDEIAEYVSTGEPMDKAGAYAIQGGAAAFVESVEGTLSNVIGLPIDTLRPILERALRA
jgi:septum formation protein